MYAHTHILKRDAAATFVTCEREREVNYFFAGDGVGGLSAGVGCATMLPSGARLSTTTVCSDCTSFDSRANTCTRLLPAHSGMSASNSIFVRSPARRFG